jgi:hypothetical protein
MPTLLVEYTGRTYVPSLPPTNRDCNDTPNEIDGAGYITATVPEESGMVFTQRLYVHRGPPFHSRHPHHRQRAQDARGRRHGRNRLHTTTVATLNEVRHHEARIRPHEERDPTQ